MADFHFIDDPTVLDIIDAILAIAGPNFAPPHDGGAQPYDGVEGNRDTLLQFQMPGGAEMQGYAEPSNFGSIGTAINTLLAAFAPAFSAYALILPILGVIRGIIEIICAMMNPFAVIAAVIRLFSKWIPPFISLFPPLAGVVIIISVIKLIIAIVFYILTVVVPTIQLIIDCFVGFAEVIGDANLPLDIKQARILAIEDKVESIVKTLIQKFGILGSMLPLLQLVILILGLVSGFPCKGGRAADTGILDFGFNAGLDSTCCDDFCPEIFSDRNKQPSGIGVMIPSFYGDCAPGFVFQLFTSNPDVQQFEPFQESFQEQLNCQLDEPIKHARPPGATADRSLVKVRLESRRGFSRTVTLPVLDINGTVLKITSPLAILFLGVVNYTVIPDYDMLVMHNMMGIGCHPDVKSVSDEVASRFANLDTPIVERFPRTETLFDDTSNLFDDINALVNVDLQECIDSAFSRTNPDDVDTDVECANNVQSDLITTLTNFTVDLTETLNGIISGSVDTNSSVFEVDRPEVKADADDFATISIAVRDITRTSILRNLPDGVGVNVDIINDFGVVSNQQLAPRSGVITAEIRSATAGTANITVKVNGELIVDRDINGNITTRTREVKFIQEAVLPARRRRSKPSAGKAINTGTGSSREPGNR